LAGGGGGGGTQTSYGIVVGDPSDSLIFADAVYGIYIADQTSSSNADYGLYITGADNFAIFTAADDVSLNGGDFDWAASASSSDNFALTSTTTHSGTAGLLEIDVSTATNQNSGINLSYTNTATGSTSNYGMYGAFAQNGVTTGTSITTNFFSGWFTNTKNGSDTLTTGTLNYYGVYGAATYTDTTVTGSDTATRNIYGGYFSATGDTDGTGNAIGVFATAASGDTNDSFYSGIAFRNDAASTTALCWDNSGASAILDCTAPPGDYTEVYPTESDVSYEEIVTIGQNETTVNHTRVDEAGQTSGPEIRTLRKLTKATRPYDENVIGITSENWSDFSSIGKNDVRSEDNPKPVTLSGRVVVKVTDENGPINVGDYLTTSSTPGAAMRADPRLGVTIGRALEVFTQNGEGRILVFVQTNTSPNLQTAFADINLNALSFATSSNNTTIDTFGNITTAGQLSVNCQMSSVNCLSVANDAFTVDDLGNVATTGNITTTGQLQGQTLNITGDAQIGGNLIVNGQVSIVNGSLETSQLSALSSQDLTIRLGDSAGVNSLVILNSIEDQLFTINSAGGTTLAADGAYLSIPRGYICIDDDGTCDVTGPVNGTIYADAFVTNSTADIAEAFPTKDDSIEAGNLVAVDPENKESIELSNYPYQPTILGIISTDPGVTLNALNEDGPRLALAGRVPTKVNLENGPIKAGDPITSSSTAGVGMRASRAGRIVGIALEDYGPQTTDYSNERAVDSSQNAVDNFAVGKIIVFVEPGWYIGSALADNGSIQGIDPPSEASAKDGLPYNLADSATTP